MRLDGYGFFAEVDDQRGTMTSLAPAGASYFADYVHGQPAFQGDEFLGGFGDLQIAWRVAGETTWSEVASASLRPEVRQDATGINTVFVTQPGLPFSIAHCWRLSDGRDTLLWEAEVVNETGGELELGQLTVLLHFNTNYVHPTDEDLYRKSILVDAFAGGQSSFLVGRCLSGAGPILLVLPTGDTAPECVSHVSYAGRHGSGRLTEVHLFSLAAGELRNWVPFARNGSACRRGAGEAIRLGLKFCWPDSQRLLGDYLVREGKVAVRAVPGFVVPQGESALVHIRCAQAVHDVALEGGRAEPLSGSPGVYRLVFDVPGEHALKVRYGTDHWARFLFRAKASGPELLRRRAAFTVENQQCTDDCGGRRYAFLMWDAEEGTQVREARHLYLIGGSDEVGFADALVLAEKNVYLPRAEEIAALENYVEHFLLGKMQSPETFGVRLWWGDESHTHSHPRAAIDEPSWVEHTHRGSDTDRSFNYPHVFNIYLALYRIAKYFGATRFRDAKGYLALAYRTALAYFTLPMRSGDAIRMGNMGETTLLEMLIYLREEGMEDERLTLKAHLDRKADYMCQNRFAYRSEFAFDTTGYEAAYLFRLHRAERQVAQETLEVILATRALQPTWYSYQSDMRWGPGAGKRPEIDGPGCLNYMTGWGCWALLTAFHATADPYYLFLGYAGLVGNWALVSDEGVMHHHYNPEPKSRAFDPWSGEAGMGIHACLIAAEAFAVEDQALGLLGLGCQVRAEEDSLSLRPMDALGARAMLVPLGLRVVGQGCRLEEVEGGRDRQWLRVTIAGVWEEECHCSLRFEGLQPGLWEVTEPGGGVRSWDTRGQLSVPFTLRGRRLAEVRLNYLGSQPITQEP